jgi:hypothetical protein
MQPSVYDAILPNIRLTLTVSTELVASFFSSSRLTRSSRRTDTSGPIRSSATSEIMPEDWVYLFPEMLGVNHCSWARTLSRSVHSLPVLQVNAFSDE